MKKFRGEVFGSELSNQVAKFVLWFNGFESFQMTRDLTKELNL